VGDDRSGARAEDLGEVMADQFGVAAQGVALALGFVGESEPGRSSTTTR
jgi:hypothetical protein